MDFIRANPCEWQSFCSRKKKGYHGTGTWKNRDQTDNAVRSKKWADHIRAILLLICSTGCILKHE
jgi:hypothetical protein